MPACEQALQDLKRYLTSPPLLSKPKDGEQLYIYLAVSEGAVSAVLVREEEGKQFPVYYVSKSLLDAETRYTQLEKLALALVTAARKLRPYFQCHPITVYTTYPLKSILHKPELSGRLTKWTVELSEYDITFQPRTALKSQVLADFVADFAPNVTQQADKDSSNVNGAGIGLVLTSPEGDLIQQAIRCGFKATNNEAEYEALIAGLNLAKDMGIKKLSLWADELPGVLWAYRTTAKTSTGETPFALAYGTEAVIPVECGIPSARYMWLDEDSNTELLNHSLDAIDELRDKAHLRTALYQQKVAQHYNKNIRVRTFKTGDWVLRRVFQNTKEAGAGKLGPNWEGPYKITKIVGHGAYKLQARDGRDIHNSWNATHLKLYHF
ncbi:hypothetical protein UlMin_018536 [Ulmus minor]